ncbi:MAG: cellulose synthase subunit BcsC-related outer membrane protein [Pseudomonadota bacterium]
MKLKPLFLLSALLSSPCFAAPPPPLRDANEAELSAKAVELFEAKDFKGSLFILKQMQPKIIAGKDAGMISLLGYAALNAGESQLAIDSFKLAAEWTEDEEFFFALSDTYVQLKQPEEAKKVLESLPQSKDRDRKLDELLGVEVNALFQSGQYGAAEKMLLDSKFPLGASNLELLGWIQLRLGKLAEAAASFEASYRKKPSRGAAQGLAFSHQRLKSTDKLIVLADSLKGPLLDLTQDPAVRESIAAGKLNRIGVDADGKLTLAGAGSYAPPDPGLSVAVGPAYRQRNGDDGQGKLDVVGVTAVAEWVDDKNRVTIRARQFQADNGETREDGLSSVYALLRHQGDEGLEYSAGLGISPAGGAISPTPVGELGVASYGAENGWNAQLFRRTNEESILSMSGLYDPVSRQTWGQVMENGLTLGGYYTLPDMLKDWKAEGSLTVSQLEGQGVADNQKLAFWGRALRPIDGVDGLRAGAVLYASAFDKNLSYYTPGFGGYFSPEASVNITPALVYEGALGDVELKTQAGLGWGYAKQASADGNPLTGQDPGKYPGGSSSGLASFLDLDAQLPLDKSWTLGLNLGGQSSPDYEEWYAWLYARYYFGSPSASSAPKAADDGAAPKSDTTEVKPAQP